jgi:UDP-N-acetylmuramoyl-tripeptide--D-alanyl-D-alanine ligase
MFSVEDVVRGTQGALIGGDLAIPVSGVSIDTRTLGVGDAFFAIQGQTDGHRHLKDAVARGAACLVVHALPDDVPATLPVVLVDETTRALGRFAAYHRARFTVPVAAVTGSNGKTTTKELMAGALSALGPVLKPAGSFNNQWGLPLTLLQITSSHRAVAIEIGTNHPGEIAALAALARPTVAAVTVVSTAHTEFLGSLDDVAVEKGALVAAVPVEGAVVLNIDDPRVAGMAARSRARVLTVSAGGGPADLRAADVAETPAGMLVVTLEARGGRHAAQLAFAGRHNVVNALCAAGVGLALGLPLADIAAGLETARPAKGRVVWREAGGVRLLDDTYNANPASVLAALDTLRAAQGPRRLIVVLGDMLELGDVSVAAHRQVGETVAAAGVAEFVGVGRYAQAAVEAARARGLVEAHHTTTFEDTVALLLKRLAPGDALLVKGSRGMRMERVVDALLARLGGEDA